MRGLGIIIYLMNINLIIDVCLCAPMFLSIMSNRFHSSICSNSSSSLTVPLPSPHLSSIPVIPHHFSSCRCHLTISMFHRTLVRLVVIVSHPLLARLSVSLICLIEYILLHSVHSASRLFMLVPCLYCSYPLSAQSLFIFVHLYGQMISLTLKSVDSAWRDCLMSVR